MNLIFWNCRGLGQAPTVRALREFCYSHKPMVVFLLETKIQCTEKLLTIVKFIGFDDFCFVPSCGSSGGTILMWKNSIAVQIINTAAHFITVMILNHPAGAQWFLTGVYGPPNPLLKPNFWDDLNRSGESIVAPWCVVGDFNAIVAQKEKIGGRPFTSGSRCRFRHFIDAQGLMDLSFTGNPFTWSNRQAGKANIQERLDRAMGNSQWSVLFLQASLCHLAAISSDHKPICLFTSPVHSSRPKPFRFEAMWLRDPSIGDVVSHAWTKGSNSPTLVQLMTKLKYTKLALKEWNKLHFRHVQTNITELKTLLETLQSLPLSATNLNWENMIHSDLDELLKREQILWRDKGKERWLVEGDANTHYFHMSTIANRRFNSIHHILTDDSVRVAEQDAIGQLFVNFYTHLFCSGVHHFPTDLQRLVSPSIPLFANLELCMIPEVDEIRTTIFSMHGNKSLGPDGMSPAFYKHCWGIIEVDVVSAVQSYFKGSHVDRAVNHTFLTLIPKREGANKVEQFRPIALCNVIYKVVTKILVVHLKPHLGSIIHPSQSAFIPGRAIMDNIIINQEIMTYLNATKGTKGFMAVKVDIAKAYDIVEWDIFRVILRAHGFSEDCGNLITGCISSAHYSVLVNGSPYGFFPGSRGLRQGDPLSHPLLITLASRNSKQN